MFWKVDQGVCHWWAPWVDLSTWKPENDSWGVVFHLCLYLPGLHGNIHWKIQELGNWFKEEGKPERKKMFTSFFKSGLLSAFHGFQRAVWRKWSCLGVAGGYIPSTTCICWYLYNVFWLFSPPGSSLRPPPLPPGRYLGALTKEMQVTFVSQGCFCSSTTGRNCPVALKLSKTRGMSDRVDSPWQKSSDSLAKPTNSAVREADINWAYSFNVLLFCHCCLF